MSHVDESGLQHRLFGETPPPTRASRRQGRGEIKIPTAREFFARTFYPCIGQVVRPNPLAEIIEVIVRGYRLDSEQFRSAPRTCRPLCGRLSVRWTRL